MTHGEAWFVNKRSFDIQNAERIDAGLPPRMSRKEASKYYNKKLFEYWCAHLDSKFSKEIISLLMFGNPYRYKEIYGTAE